jgi:multiple sugar transport system substrate-binding protein
MSKVRTRILGLTLAAAGLCYGTLAQAGTLAINVAFKGASQRAVWQSVFDDFKKTHPDIDMKVAFVDEEAYKVQLPGWLSSVAPDVVNWHDGERMAYYARRGLLEDLSGDWAKNGWNETYASTKEASSWNGKQYAMPTVYYSWGMFYRKDLFQKVGINGEPKTWDQFIDACKKLKAAGLPRLPWVGAMPGRWPAGLITWTCASTAMPSTRS